MCKTLYSPGISYLIFKLHLSTIIYFVYVVGVEARGLHLGVSFLLPSGSWDSNSSHQPWQPATIPSVLASIYVILTQTTAILEEGTSAEKMPPTDWPVDKPMGHFLNW